MNDNELIRFVKNLGNSLEERIDILEDFITYSDASILSTQEWLALSEIHKLLCEERTKQRVEAIRRETPINEAHP